MSTGVQTSGTFREEDTVRLCFTSQDGSKDFVKVHKETNVQKLVQFFCTRREIKYRTAVFLFDGKRLPSNGTVNEVGLMDQDEIDVMIPQTGG